MHYIKKYYLSMSGIPDSEKEVTKKYLPYLVVATVKNNLTIEDSKRLIKEEMDSYSNFLLD